MSAAILTVRKKSRTKSKSPNTLITITTSYTSDKRILHCTTLYAASLEPRNI